MTTTVCIPVSVLDLTFVVEQEPCVHAMHPLYGDVGFMVLDALHDGGRRITELYVDPQFQRQGVATAMWEHAIREGLTPAHSSYRSADGDAWALSVSPESDIPPNSWLDDNYED